MACSDDEDIRLHAKKYMAFSWTQKINTKGKKVKQRILKRKQTKMKVPALNFCFKAVMAKF